MVDYQSLHYKIVRLDIHRVLRNVCQSFHSYAPAYFEWDGLRGPMSFVVRAVSIVTRQPTCTCRVYTPPSWLVFLVLGRTLLLLHQGRLSWETFTNRIPPVFLNRRVTTSSVGYFSLGQIKCVAVKGRQSTTVLVTSHGVLEWMLQKSVDWLQRSSSLATCFTGVDIPVVFNLPYIICDSYGVTWIEENYLFLNVWMQRNIHSFISIQPLGRF
jgi:hypothetical protein